MGILFAFCCLFCSAASDFVFKLFARKPRPRGLFTAIVGVVCASVACFGPNPFDFSAPTLIWGGLTGLLSIAANLLLIEALGMISAGVGATIFRLNLVPVTLGAWLILGETISSLQWCGIIAAIAAILCFTTKPEKPSAVSGSPVRKGLLLAILACLLRAGLGLTCKYGLLQGASRSGIVLLIGLCWAVVGTLYSFFRERKQWKLDSLLLGYGLLSGICVTGITVFLAASLQYGQAAVVLPIEQMSFPLTLLFSAVILKEKITRWKAAAVLLGVLAVLLLSL